LSKLLKLKEWLTVPDAARHLSTLLEPGVGEADVLRLALDGRLKLSVFFPKATPAFSGAMIVTDNLTDHLPDDRVWTSEGNEEDDFDAYMQEYYGWSSNEDTILIEKTTKQVLQVATHCEVSGVFDLAMLGGVRDYIEHEYRRLISNNPINAQSKHDLKIESIPVVREINERGSRAYGLVPRPPDFFPEGSLLVVRITALQEFETANSTQQPKPLAKRERDTLLVIIAALAKLAKIDLSMPSSAAASIERQSELMGTRVAARTIENHLNRIPGALEDRGADGVED
jgi:hypothetical protein